MKLNEGRVEGRDIKQRYRTKSLMVLASAIRLVMIIVLILLGVKLAKVSIRLGELMMLRARIREVLLLLQRALTLGEISTPKGILVGVKLPVRLSIEHLLG